MTHQRSVRSATSAPTGAVPRVGVLSLQGDFHKHSAMLAMLGCTPVRVSLPEHMAQLEALILPGGESSTMLRLLEHTGLRAPVQKWVCSKPVLGTCAGLILLAESADKLPRAALGAIDISAERNGWGRQVHSFTAEVDVAPLAARFTGVFIRAPRIQRVGRSVQVIATYHGEPVGVRAGHAVALAFHPELTDDSRIHAWFLTEVAGLRVHQPEEAQ